MTTGAAGSMATVTNSGTAAAAVLNAANEIAVAAFLAGRLRFTRIPEVIEAALESVPTGSADDLTSVLDADARARAAATSSVVRNMGCAA